MTPNHSMVEHTGLEPVTSSLPAIRAPSCANAPVLLLYIRFTESTQKERQFPKELPVSLILT